MARPSQRGLDEVLTRNAAFWPSLLADPNNEILVLTSSSVLGVVDNSQSGVADWEETPLTQTIERMAVHPVTHDVVVTVPLSTSHQLFGVLDVNTGSVTVLATLSVHIQSTYDCKHCNTEPTAVLSCQLEVGVVRGGALQVSPLS